MYFSFSILRWCFIDLWLASFLRRSLLSFLSLLLCTLLLLSHVLLFTTPWTAARQASLSIISRSLLKLVCWVCDVFILTMSFFPLTAFKIFSLYLVLSNVTMICISVCVFVFFCIYPDWSLNFSDSFIFSSSLSQLFSSDIFFYLPFFFSFWNCSYICIIPRVTVGSLHFSPVVSNLLSFTSSVFFLSDM